MAILSPIVEAPVRPVVKSGCHVHLCRAVGAQFIGDDPLWNKAIALYQRHQQALGRPLVAPLMQDFFENGPMLIDCAPEPELLSSVFHNDLVQIPNIAHAPINSDIGRHLRSTRDAPAMMHDKFDIGVLFGQL